MTDKQKLYLKRALGGAAIGAAVGGALGYQGTRLYMKAKVIPKLQGKITRNTQLRWIGHKMAIGDPSQIVTRKVPKYPAGMGVVGKPPEMIDKEIYGRLPNLNNPRSARFVTKKLKKIRNRNAFKGAAAGAVVGGGIGYGTRDKR